MKKSAVPCGKRFFANLTCLFSEAVAAENRLVAAGLERNLAGLSALGADRVVHLAGAVVTVVLPCHPAGLAALGFVGEAFLGVKLLLAGCKREFLSAILADDGFVAKHEIPL